MHNMLLAAPTSSPCRLSPSSRWPQAAGRLQQHYPAPAPAPTATPAGRRTSYRCSSLSGASPPAGPRIPPKGSVARTHSKTRGKAAPGERSLVPAGRRHGVVAAAGGVSVYTLTDPVTCCAVAAVLIFLKKSNEMLLLAVMAATLPSTYLAALRSGSIFLWFAWAGLLLKHFFKSWPGVLELPLLFLLLVIVAPTPVLGWLSSNMAMICNVTICVYLFTAHVVSYGVRGAAKGGALLVTALLGILVVGSIRMASFKF